MKETPYELLKDNEKIQLGKNEEAKMTIYNALPRKEFERVFMCKTAKEVWHTLIITHHDNSQVKSCKIDLLSQEYEKFLIFNEETIDSDFTRLNTIVTSLKSLDPDYSSKNHVRKFLRALPSKWRAKTTKEKVKSLALKVKVTREQTSDDSDSQGGSDEDIDEEEAEAFNLLARNFRKFFHKGNPFGRRNQFGNEGNRFGKVCGNSFGNKGGESSKQKGACYNCGIEGHFASECRKPKENKAFVGGAWSDSEDGEEHQNDAACLMAIDSQEVCLKSDLLPDDWIMDNGCTKHMTRNRRLFTSYKAYDGGHVVFGSNLKGKVIGGGNITHDSITITNVEHCDDDYVVRF
ncbi:retrovirus-related pol polyprotein from transposon TNT 1-94 [Tanacetum coccineum]